MVRSFCAGALAVGALASMSLGHNHLTVDTATGSPGDSILIKAGYYPAESQFSISGGRLLQGGQTAVYALNARLQQPGPWHDFFAGDEVLLTSDFYFFTNRLAGGDFMWEIVSVVEVDHAHSSQMVWGQFDEFGAFTALADSTATTRLARSFNTPGGDHNHDQAYAFQEAGLFDVTLVAWDNNNIYTDSAPLTIRFQVGTVCEADYDHSGVVDVADLFLFLDDWFAQNGSTGGHFDPDVDHDMDVDVVDLFAFLDSWFAENGVCGF